jgi:hypothetical protein
MGVPKKISIVESWRNLSEHVYANNLLPDEDGEAFLELAHQLSLEFAAKTEMEHLIVRDIIHLEWEKRRLRRWICNILRRRAAGFMATALKESSPQGLGRGKSVEPLVEEWLNTSGPERDASEARIRAAGVDPTAIVIQAHNFSQDSICRFEADLRSMDTRRRRLMEDLRRLQARRRPDVADAEIVGG